MYVHKQLTQTHLSKTATGEDSVWVSFQTKSIVGAWCIRTKAEPFGGGNKDKDVYWPQG